MFIGRKLSSAGLNVFLQEPLAWTITRSNLSSMVITPHIGFDTGEAVERCHGDFIQNFAKFLAGRRQNICKLETAIT